jgi:hypothetical protein
MAYLFDKILKTISECSEFDNIEHSSVKIDQMTLVHFSYKLLEKFDLPVDQSVLNETGFVPNQIKNEELP